MERSVLQNGNSDPAPSPARGSLSQTQVPGGKPQTLAEVQNLRVGHPRSAGYLLIEHLHLIQLDYHRSSAAHSAALALEMGLPQAEGRTA